jgi:hypothetical protein
LVKRRNEALSNETEDGSKRQRLDCSQLERLKDNTVPLWRLTPEEQVRQENRKDKRYQLTDTNFLPFFILII